VWDGLRSCWRVADEQIAGVVVHNRPPTAVKVEKRAVRVRPRSVGDIPLSWNPFDPVCSVGAHVERIKSQVEPALR